MIEYIKNNLIYAKEKVILHGCNAQGVMNSGVARAIKEAFPNAYQKYRKYYKWSKKDNTSILGIIIPVKCDDKMIVNAITQEFYGRDEGVQYVDYKAMRSCFIETRNLLKALKETDIAMPFVGAGLGGGSWDKISKIIEEELKNYNIKVYYRLDSEYKHQLGIVDQELFK